MADRYCGEMQGEDRDGNPKSLAVYKSGRTWKLSTGTFTHMCHPSRRDLEGVRIEAIVVFDKSILPPLSTRETC